MPCPRLVLEGLAFTGSSAEASKIIVDSECIVVVREWPSRRLSPGYWASVVGVEGEEPTHVPLGRRVVGFPRLADRQRIEHCLDCYRCPPPRPPRPYGPHCE
jgi:hypothetical protein